MTNVTAEDNTRPPDVHRTVDAHLEAVARHHAARDRDYRAADVAIRRAQME
jgi:hypothetical protein